MKYRRSHCTNPWILDKSKMEFTVLLANSVNFILRTFWKGFVCHSMIFQKPICEKKITINSILSNRFLEEGSQ
ncbi:MAG: hypothetical protein D6732_13410 [Methanobacteriota archaeon]|nr:MAG: hypothetical protein D6732_13410 [Euryarchaeota archaeon]